MQMYSNSYALTSSVSVKVMGIYTYTCMTYHLQKLGGLLVGFSEPLCKMCCLIASFAASSTYIPFSIHFLYFLHATVPQCSSGTHACRDLLQCVHTSGLCDGTSDCRDSSDEYSCNGDTYGSKRTYNSTIVHTTTQYVATSCSKFKLLRASYT